MSHPTLGIMLQRIPPHFPRGARTAPPPRWLGRTPSRLYARLVDRGVRSQFRGRRARPRLLPRKPLLPWRHQCRFVRGSLPPIQLDMAGSLDRICFNLGVRIRRPIAAHVMHVTTPHTLKEGMHSL